MSLFRLFGGDYMRSDQHIITPSVNLLLSGLGGSVGAGGTATLDLVTGSFCGILASGDFTIANPTPAKMPSTRSLGLGSASPGKLLVVQVVSNAAVGITISWGTEWHFNGAWPVLGAGLTMTSLWVCQWNPSGVAKVISLIGRDNDQP